MTVVNVVALYPIVPRFWLLARASRVQLVFAVDELVERAPGADVVLVPAGRLASAEVERLAGARGARTALVAAAPSADHAARQARLELFDEVLAQRGLERQLMRFLACHLAAAQEAA